MQCVILELTWRMKEHQGGHLGFSKGKSIENGTNLDNFTFIEFSIEGKFSGLRSTEKHEISDTNFTAVFNAIALKLCTLGLAYERSSKL